MIQHTLAPSDRLSMTEAIRKYIRATHQFKDDVEFHALNGNLVGVVGAINSFEETMFYLADDIGQLTALTAAEHNCNTTQGALF